MERHIQTAIQCIIVGLVLWLGNAVIESRDAMTRLTEQVTQVRREMSEMNSRFDKYLLRTEADAKFDAQESKHVEIDRRLDVLENRRRM